MTVLPLSPNIVIFGYKISIPHPIRNVLKRYYVKKITLYSYPDSKKTNLKRIS